ncbi:hypothetical protein RYX36_024618 [Vicia faba]
MVKLNMVSMYFYLQRIVWRSMRGEAYGCQKSPPSQSSVHYLGRTPLPYYYIEEMMRYDDRDLEEFKAAIDWEKEETNKEEEDIIVYLSDKKKRILSTKNSSRWKNLL